MLYNTQISESMLLIISIYLENIILLILKEKWNIGGFENMGLTYLTGINSDHVRGETSTRCNLVTYHEKKKIYIQSILIWI